MAWVEALSLGELGEYDMDKITMNDGTRIAVIRMDDDVYAIDDTCSHAEASLSEGELLGNKVKCPLHGAEFDVRTGEVKSFPAVVGVTKYETKIEDNTIYVNYGE
ncbi:MAG: non-heme iron oxygenase ferredoxin subunit [Candidatus Marinimicrobia bacterium]|nr:non-heme iron oxygenase ferredoxin subunit [Candidatus Neomarinimicrobiota bacterium]MCF7828037.1 non-heme iron oxygenase ferredoxin subunit [Candidatus Neomarinimicrobiota bacterium]MCF7879208.1 non-heme iron oxygenase ferredoxin subunit [Candidatus Neomarinimicrobiota bacterium]